MKLQGDEAIFGAYLLIDVLVLKVSKSQKRFFLKLYCQKSDLNF